MGRVYSVIGSNLNVANNSPVTLVFINPAANGPGSVFDILRAWVSPQGGITSPSQQRVQIGTQPSTFPTLTSATPGKHNRYDPASGIVGGTAGAAGTCGVNASADGAGTKVPIISDQFDLLNGWLWVPTEKERIRIGIQATGEGVYLDFPAAPATLTNWSFGITFEEL